MSKVLIFSDLHAYCHKKSTSRLDDCLESLDWVYKTAKKRDIETILFCGDLFHDRQKIDVYTYQKTFEVFEKHVSNSNINTWLLLGNHDMWYLDSWEVSSVMPFQALNGVNVIGSPVTKKILGHDISFLPYTHNPIKDIQGLDGEFLIAHLAIDGAIWNRKYNTIADVSIEHDGDMIKVTPEIFKNFKHVFLGHYHAAQEIGSNAEYVGSPLQLDFGETEQDKHIIVYDLDTGEKEYIKNDFSPIHLYCDSEEIDLEGKKAFVNILTEDSTSPRNVEIQKKLKNNPDILEVTVKTVRKKRKTEERLIKNARAILQDEEKMAQRYLDEIGVENPKRAKLLEVFNFIRNKRGN